MGDITKSVKFLLLGEDRTAGKSLRGVGNDAGRTQGKLSKLGAGAKVAGAAIGAGLLVAGAAAISFGKDSLEAFADAQKSQRQLEDAYKRFPAVQSVPIAKLREYNQALQRKTGADADDIAAGQAVLARYKMTGAQLKQITPLLVDYAARTGKDMPAAASTLGKALMGSSKAVKELGVNVKLGKDPAENYKKVMDALKGSVGGYAESVPDAEKKQKILQASFGDLQEAVGEKLQPAMMALIDAGQGVLDWLDQNPAVTEGAAAAFGLFGDTLSGLWDIITTYVAPAIAWLGHIEADVVRQTGDMLAALSNLPGFEWAKSASEKVYKVADAIDAVADGVGSLANKPKPTVAVTDKASPEVAKIDKKIKALKGKIVEAKAKGDASEVKKLQKKIDELKGKSVQIKASIALIDHEIQFKVTNRGTIKVGVLAGGGIMRAYAGGGLEDHSPRIYRPTAGMRIFNEPETRGESYIPLANDWRRPRAVAIWRQTGRELGVFAGGGMTGRYTTSAGMRDVHLHVTLPTGADYRKAAKELVGALRQEFISTNARLYGGRGLGF